jgi:hypothetical protein
MMKRYAHLGPTVFRASWRCWRKGQRAAVLESELALKLGPGTPCRQMASVKCQ